MNLQKLNLKIFLENPETVHLEKFIPIFHRWIQEQNTEDLLIDVADYQHVPSGPGVLLIGQQVNYSIDNNESHLGFLYNQKAKLEEDFPNQLKKITRSAFTACEKLEREPALEGKLKFKGNELQLIVNDRLLAPNTEETFQSIKPQLSQFLSSLYGDSAFQLTHHPDPRERLTIEIHGKSSVKLAELLRRL